MKIVTESSVEYIDHMGSDLSVVNAARVSFAKQHEDFDGDKDNRLLRYLANHGHWSPFAHTSLQLRISAPIFIARQLVKHQVGLVWNEISRRYVDDEPSFFIPQDLRGRAENVKQGSGGILEDSHWANFLLKHTTEVAFDGYTALLLEDVAPEQARMVLPQNTMTEWIWTGSLLAFHRVATQRRDPHAQLEAQEVGHKIADICSVHFPNSWRALEEKTKLL